MVYELWIDLWYGWVVVGGDFVIGVEIGSFVEWYEKNFFVVEIDDFGEVGKFIVFGVELVEFVEVDVGVF